MMIIVFGTTGIRNKFATFDEEEKKFTPSVALKLGLAIGTAIESKKIVVGRDIRTAALPIEYALNSGLVSTGCDVKVIGMVTTPTLAMSIDKLDADYGVMITASHNPPEYIGIKLWNRNGLGFRPDQERLIEKIYKEKNFVKRKWNKIGTLTEVQNINKMHIDEVLKYVQPEQMKRKFDIIIDPGNGSSCEIVPLLMNHLRFKYITLNSQPDGRFPGRLSEPSSKNLQDLSDFLRLSKTTELGIALDGDADRVVFVDGNGEVIEPVRILTFLAMEYIKERYPNPEDRNGLKIATPINSSKVLEHVLNPMGVEIMRTEVGDIKVSIAIHKNGGFLGGETAGTYIWPDFHFGPDVLMTIAMLLKFLSKYDEKINDVLAQIPQFPYIKDKIELKKDFPFKKEDYEVIFQQVKPILEENGFKEIEAKYLDGLHISSQRGWMLIRKSGTTPLVRVSAESSGNISESKQLMTIGKDGVKKFISHKMAG